MTIGILTRLPRLVVVAALLASAGLACLLAALRLLDGGETPDPAAETTRLALRLGLLGALVVFLLGLGALLAARRLAFGRPPRPDRPPLDLVAIQAWSDELVAIGGDLRGTGAAEIEVEALTLEVPPSWRPDDRYRTDGAPDSLADLRRTRDQLLDAAERVEAIAEAIRVASAPAGGPGSEPGGNPPRRPWWKLR
ncbi:hypothetical protein KDM41_14110 [bacterium]|nr:hypothetical protein [bacterium]